VHTERASIRGQDRSASRGRGCARHCQAGSERATRAPRQVLATTSEDGACVLWAWELGVPAERLELPPGAPHMSSRLRHRPRMRHALPARHNANRVPSMVRLPGWHAATVQGIDEEASLKRQAGVCVAPLHAACATLAPNDNPSSRPDTHSSGLGGAQAWRAAARSRAAASPATAARRSSPRSTARATATCYAGSRRGAAARSRPLRMLRGLQSSLLGCTQSSLLGSSLLRCTVRLR